MQNSKIARFLPPLALALVVFFAWGIARDRVALRNWKIPDQYNGDALEVIGWFQVAQEGDFIPFFKEGSHRLGAPYEANWADYPTSEKMVIFGAGLVARVIGLFQATNFALVFIHILSALSFYYCCRLLKHSRTWSFVGGALFSLTYFNLYRDLGGIHLACSYTLPFAMLSCWLVLASKTMKLGDRFSWICLVTALVMGLGGPYNLNIYVQFLCFCLLAQWVKARRVENLKIGVLSLGLVAVGFLAINARTLLYQWAHGKNTYALARSYFESELYALKPIEYLIPPATHNIDALASIGRYYMSSAYVRGEICSPYLGLVVLIAAGWVFLELFLRMARGDTRPRRFPPYGPQMVWVTGYATVGGINCVIALCGFQLFRATNRYSIFISLFALMFLVARMSVWTRRWAFGPKFALAAAALLIGLVDQLPRQLPVETVAATERMIDSDRVFGAKLEEKLPRAGMVFEMPVMVYPEAPPIRNVQGYEMLRPFFFTKTLRFSYGSVRGRSREDWQWETEKLPAPQLIAQLEKFGFAALYLNRKCYPDQGEDLLKQLAAAGRNQVIEDDLHEQVCVVLNPSAHPELPHSDDRALLDFKTGWVLKEHGTGLESRNWSGGDAALTFFSEQKQVTTYSLKCAIGSISPRRVSIQIKGREVWGGQIPAGQGVPVMLSVDAWPGKNVMEFKTDQPPVQPNESSPAVAFAIMNLEITKASSN